ncbi:MAG: signal peptidase I [Candidatus Mcinerneyibacterium aminivorans]|uniref:Signal peptidase I n=1 Tax=Candidatus Mcinerneyibacterium aminivorans TaxID=2703815 RepID=A0A5D0MH81_9BACT|nr:MAG: signal peptidase I [Candidatus Mcinerneyibacterium aminivorans]
MIYFLEVIIINKITEFFISLLKDLIWALLVFFLIVKPFLLERSKIPTPSMENTLLVGDYVIVDKFTYGGKIPLTNIRVPGFRNVKKGDIVVFWEPDKSLPGVWDKLFFWRKGNSKRLVKRCVAVGGDTVEIKDKQLYINGELQEEPYVKHSDNDIIPGFLSARDNFGPLTVPEGEFFMMGDNRDNSKDSRFIGCVPKDYVIGSPLIIDFSYDKINNKIRTKRMFKILK